MFIQELVPTKHFDWMGLDWVVYSIAALELLTLCITSCHRCPNHRFTPNITEHGVETQQGCAVSPLTLKDPLGDTEPCGLPWLHWCLIVRRRNRKLLYRKLPQLQTEVFNVESKNKQNKEKSVVTTGQQGFVIFS